MYSYEQAIAMYREARIMGLSGSELLANPQDVIRDCNGIGASWMPKAMRKLATALNPVMEVPAGIHDRRYAIGGDSPGRQFDDNEFLCNTLIMIEARYAVWNPWRYLMRNRVNRYYGYLREFGAMAYGGGKKTC